jgi:nitric oxide dioxygenase
MTGEQIKLVQDSYRRVAPFGDVAAGLFYARLFEIYPGLQLLFTGDMAEQCRKLMRIIGLAVNSLDRPDLIVPAARALDAWRVTYGVGGGDHDTMRRALLWALGQGVDDAFTPEVEAAWGEAYAALAAVWQGSACPCARAQSLSYAH